MNLAVVISVAAAAINLSSAILHMAVSRAPGWRLARLPALLSLTAGLYNCGSLVFTLDGLSDPAYTLAARLAYLVAVLHCSLWIVYAYAGQEGRLRETPPWVRWLCGTALAAGLFFAVTGVHLRPVIEVIEIPWAHVRYHYLLTTPIGDVYGLTMPGLLVVAMLRLARGQHQNVGSRRWHLAAFLVFFLLVVEEVLVAGRVLRFLSLADLGFVVVVLPLALETVRRVVNDARRLEAALGQLRTSLDRRTEERDHAQSELAATAGQMHDLVSGLDAIVWEADAATMQVHFISEGAEKLLGFSPREWLATPGFWLRHLHPADREEALAGQRAAAGKDQPTALEYRMLAADGRIVWLRDILHPVAGERGEPRRLRGVMVDITDSRRAHHALWESEERFRGLFENAGVGLYRTTPEGSILLVNPALVRLLGYDSVEELLHRNLAEGGYEPGYKRADFLRRIEPTGQVVGLESAWTRRDGTAVYLRESAWAVRRPDGHTLYYDGLVEDITAQVRLGEELRQAQKMESIGRLAGGIAHDFNNLLTVINGFSELALLEVAEGDAVHAPLREILKAGERAATLTQQLLAFSRRQMLQTRVVPLNDLVTDLEDMLRRLIGEDVELRIQLDSAAGMVDVDPGQMQQALMNLAVNARDAMPQGGRLTLRTEGGAKTAEGGSAALLQISDTGCGMTPEVRQHLFEPFFTTKPQGTGLGLSTVHGIVHQSGGWIAVESEPEQGTTFRIYLPAAGRAAEPEPGCPLPAAAAQGNATILVVEDQAELRKLTVQVLTGRGYCVLPAGDGEEALEEAAAHGGPIHLLLTDVIMPHMTGKELADALRPRRPEMRVLFMSGYTDDVISRHGVLDAGVNFIPKPFSPDVLAARVQEVLDAN